LRSTRNHCSARLSITRSAPARNVSGMVSPIAFAVFRLVVGRGCPARASGDEVDHYQVTSVITRFGDEAQTGRHPPANGFPSNQHVLLSPQRSRARSIGSCTRTSGLPRLLTGLASVIRAWPVGDITAVTESPLVVLVAQGFRPDLATASFDAASPHDQWSASLLVVFTAEAFCVDRAAASFDCAYGYPRSVGGITIVPPRPNAVLVAQAFCPDPATASFDAASPHDQ
jgi:hypothetical protein